MVFSSLIFLFVFLPVILISYYLTPRNHRNALLLIFSLLFFLWGSGWFLLLFVISALVDYVVGLFIDRNKGRSSAHWWLLFSIIFNISLLVYFKYSNFFIANLNGTLFYLGVKPIGWTKVILPIGISFFTFHKISYIVDVYRGTRHALISFVDFALYLAFFPQLIAGPIVRFHEINEQIKSRTETIEKFYQGVLRFLWGLIKKIIFANSCGIIADAVFGLDIGMVDFKLAWLGVFAYTLQIYLDFSAYSDMAIGLGLMFGFRLPENFNRPYSAVSITDFWRRWHMSLSRFFRDYVYFPLGGNRIGVYRTYINLMIIFILCGMWHGANWTFLIWGLYHGGLLVIERLTGLRTLDAGSRLLLVLKRISTLLLVMVGWVFFRSASLSQAKVFIKGMFIPIQMPVPLEISLLLNGRNVFFMIVAALVLFLPRDFSGAEFLLKEKASIIAVPQLILIVIMAFYSITSLVSGSYNPFIYFQF